jgi:Vacuolar H+-ATPase V1 sector, subunit H
LFDIISALREKKDGSVVSLTSTFYENGKLLDEWRPLLRILHLGGSGDPFAQRGASLCLAYILLVGCPSVAGGSNHVDYSSVEEPLQALLSWISSQLQSSLGSSVSLVTPTLTALVNCREARYMFASSGGIGYIARHLRNKTSVSSVSKTSRKKNSGATVQQLYELCFTIWATSYECNSSYSIRSSFLRDGAVKSLCDLVKSAPREKVIRVALSALRNLAECKSDGLGHSGKKEIDGSTFLNDMISCGLMKQIDLMKDRIWSDDDIKEGTILHLH